MKYYFRSINKAFSDGQTQYQIKACYFNLTNERHSHAYCNLLKATISNNTTAGGVTVWSWLQWGLHSYKPGSHRDGQGKSNFPRENL